MQIPLNSYFVITLLVIGVGAAITPMSNIPAEALYRDFMVMLALTIALFVMAYGFRGSEPKITRFEGSILLVSFFAYMGVLIYTAMPA